MIPEWIRDEYQLTELKISFAGHRAEKLEEYTINAVQFLTFQLNPSP